MEQKPIAIKTTCNWGGIAILDIDSDYVVSAEHYGDGYLRKAKAMIRYTLKGEPYFMRRGRREHLRDYIRVGRCVNDKRFGSHNMLWSKENYGKGRSKTVLP